MFKHLVSCGKKSYLQFKKLVVYLLSFWSLGMLSLLHNFIQQSLNSGSVQAQILFGACQRFSEKISKNL